MPEKQPSPFASLGGLDKALLRSTQQASPPERPPEQPAPVAEPPRAEIQTDPLTPATKRPGKRARNNDGNSDSQTESKIASKDASLIASKLASNADVVQTIRKAVKMPGKEVSFVRLTAEEKGQLADIVYTYKRQGKKTSENEINRIAINYILEDYKTNGEHSILASVIEALLS